MKNGPFIEEKEKEKGKRELFVEFMTFSVAPWTIY